MPTTTTVPAALKVRDGLARYLADNQFSTAAYTAPTFQVEAFGRVHTYRNKPWRMQAIPLHDLHHVATGFGTDLAGEGEVSAWELRSGVPLGPGFFLITVGMLAGWLLAPLRVWRAFRRGRRCRSLYDRALPYERLLEMTVGELRAHLGIPPDGLADQPARVHASARRLLDG